MNVLHLENYLTRLRQALDALDTRKVASLRRERRSLHPRLSASGNSPNILRAIAAAQQMGVETFGLLGFDGGKAKNILDAYLLVPSNNYGVVEDAHMTVIHLITSF